MLDRENRIFMQFQESIHEGFLRAHAISEEITALVVDDLPHIKVVPAFQMLIEDYEAGRLEGVHTLVVDSSGNTAHGVGRLAAAFGFQMIAVVANDTPAAKQAAIATLPGASILAVHGSEVVKKAKELGALPGHYHLDQYSHEGNVRGHELYTGPAIMQALNGRHPSVIAMSLGSGGTLTGVARYLQRYCPETLIVGVRPASGERVPGARDQARMEAVVRFGWEEMTDQVVEISRRVAFEHARDLWSHVDPQPGPTSGLAYAGLLKALSTLELKKNPSAEHPAVFLCPDSAHPYLDVTKAELDL